MDSAAIKYSSHCVPRVEDDPSVLLGRGAGCTQCITHTARPTGQSCRCVLSALCTALLSKQCSNMTDLPQQVRATLCRTHSDSEQSPVLQSRQTINARFLTHLWVLEVLLCKSSEAERCLPRISPRHSTRPIYIPILLSTLLNTLLSSSPVQNKTSMNCEL